MQRQALEARIEADRQRVEADRQRSEQMFQWMQNLSARMGELMPALLFPPPHPAEGTPVSTSLRMGVCVLTCPLLEINVHLNIHPLLQRTWLIPEYCATASWTAACGAKF
jgi:hypothetical protein